MSIRTSLVPVAVALVALALTACTDAPVTAPIVRPALTDSPALEVAPGVAAITDIAYATRSPAEKLDLHLPSSGTKPYPVVIWIHGGGWYTGDKALGVGAPPRLLLPYGIAVVSVNYRLSGVAKFPAQIHDVKAALRWVRANAKKYALDPNRIGAWGLSAGGHLAALLGTSNGVAAMTDLTMGNATTSEQVKTVVDWSGPVSFLTMDSQLALDGCPLYGGTGYSAATSPTSMLLGSPIQTVPSKVRAANPRTYVSAGDARFLVQHGKLDCTVPWQQSDGLVADLRAALGTAQAQLDVFPTGRHGGVEFTGSTNMTRVINYIRATL